MKKLVLGIFLVATVFVTSAKEKNVKVSDTENTAAVMLTGSISDIKSGESLVGVEVKIEGTDLKTYTDFDGKFSFKNVKPGEYKLVTNYISYEKKSESLQISATENKVKIELQSSN